MTKSIPLKASRAKKSKATATPAVVLNHTEFIEGSDPGDAALNDLIASLNAPEPDEVVEAVTAIDDAILNAAVSGAEATEAMILSATPAGVVDAGAIPTGDASDVVADKPEKKAKTPKEPKAAALPRKHYADKTERLKDKLGAGLVDYSVLTLADAGVTEAELGAVMENTMNIIRAMNSKEQNWAVKFVEYMAGKKASLSEVTARIFKVLERDGAITTGNEGNVFKDLIARPYSAGSARAMGGNNIGMLVDLKVILADGKGRFVANPDSLLLMKVKSMMTASPAIIAGVEADVGEELEIGEDTADEGELVAA